MRRLLLLLIGPFLPSLLLGQLMIEGNLHWEDSGEPVEFATIYTRGKLQGCFANEHGQFSMAVDSLPDSIFIDSPGSHTYRWPVSGQVVGGVLRMDIRLPSHESCLCIAPVIVISQPHESYMDVVKPTEMSRSDLSSIEQGLNLVPGVKFESRGAGGSRRIAIRGGLIRSAFGVREVKVYLDGAPLTSPDGSTPLELLDAQGLSQITVVKGPNSAEYGAVSNGVLLANSQIHSTQLGQRGFRLNQQIGSFGYSRTAISQAYRKGQRHGSIHYVHQQARGYRALESNSKDHLQANFGWTKGRHHWDVFALAYAGNWGLPGSLDSAQVAQDPRQALPYSLSADAHVERRHLRGTLAHSFLGQKFSNLCSAYLHGSDKTNPFGTSLFFQGYKLERSISTGFRNLSSLDLARDWVMTARLEHQSEWLDYREFENIEGNPGPRRLIAINRTSQSMGNLGLLMAKSSHFLSAEASLSQVVYAQDIASSIADLDDAKSGFPLYPAFLVRYTHSHGNEQKPSFHLTAMNGFSPPAVWEIMDSTGGFRNDLRPERGLNLEARGSKTFFFKGIRLATSINAYHHRTTNAILPRTLSSGRTYFENRGKVNSTGLEAQLDISKDWEASKWNDRLSLSLNGTFQRIHFQSYPLNGEDFKGNRVPGAPALLLNAVLDWEFTFGTVVQLTSSLVGRNYLNNANTVAQQGYNLLGAKVSHLFELHCFKHDQLRIMPNAGINNALNQHYTNFPQLNAAAGKYWNPAPGMNWFAGLELQF